MANNQNETDVEAELLAAGKELDKVSPTPPLLL